jgi:RNA recognition motif-containing protein
MEFVMKLHLGNLPKTMTDAELKKLVAAHAEPTSLEIIKDATGASKGFGFAEFANDAQGQAVIAGMDGKDVGGQTVKVGVARPRKGDKV